MLIRIPLKSGLVGKCVSENEIIRIADAYDCEDFNDSVDTHAGQSLNRFQELLILVIIL